MLVKGSKEFMEDHGERIVHHFEDVRVTTIIEDGLCVNVPCAQVFVTREGIAAVFYHEEDDDTGEVEEKFVITSMTNISLASLVPGENKNVSKEKEIESM